MSDLLRRLSLRSNLGSQLTEDEKLRLFDQIDDLDRQFDDFDIGPETDDQRELQIQEDEKIDPRYIDTKTGLSDQALKRYDQKNRFPNLKRMMNNYGPETQKERDRRIKKEENYGE